jgi:xylose dehydrogenase (NAD/NADP)
MRWGFLGAGFVASRAMAPAVHAADGAVLQRAASRELSRTTALGPRHASSSYREVIEADDVDAVYISLTNEAHEEWVLAALAAGKHVLCEKPLSMTSRSVEGMIAAQGSAAAPGPLLIEALWYRWHPRFSRTMELLEQHVIGRVETVESRFCFSGVPIDNYRLDPSRGGGAVLDVGPYVVDAVLMAHQAGAGRSSHDVEIESRHLVTSDPAGKGEVVLSMDATLQVGSISAEIAASIDRPAQQSFVVRGDQGSLSWAGGEAFTVWNQPCELRLETIHGPRTVAFDAVDPYRLMVEQSSRAMAGLEASLMPLQDSLRLAKVLETLQDSPTLI